MNLMFKISSKENTKMSSLVKLMCTLKSRLSVNTEEGEVKIYDMPDENVEMVIDAISETFNILSVNIEPTVEEPELLEPEVIEPEVTEDSLEFPKIEFSNSEVEYCANSLMKAVYWAIYSKNALVKDICNYLKSAKSEISMRYDNIPVIPVSIRDIVDCNFGVHPNGEISGGHIHAVVCNIDKGSVFVLPITKNKNYDDPKKYLQLKAGKDIMYNDPRYSGGAIILDKGRYICLQRISSVIGKLDSSVFKTLLQMLPASYEFYTKDSLEIVSESEKNGDVENDDDMLSFETFVEVIPKTNDTEVESEESSESVEKEPEDCSENDTPNILDKKNSAEEILSNYISEALENFKTNKACGHEFEICLKSFLNDIIYPFDDEVVYKAFFSVSEVPKCTLENIILNIQNYQEEENISKYEIKRRLKASFNEWIQKNPELQEKYPKISMITLLKIFAKNMN